MSSQIVDYSQTSNNKDARDKTQETKELGGLSTAMDKADPGLQNASGTSEQRRGEDISYQQDPGEKGYAGTRTATESTINSIEKGL